MVFPFCCVFPCAVPAIPACYAAREGAGTSENVTGAARIREALIVPDDPLAADPGPGRPRCGATALPVFQVRYFRSGVSGQVIGALAMRCKVEAVAFFLAADTHAD
jgi:hypothetical protein